jgi:hypothetical protein
VELLLGSIAALRTNFFKQNPRQGRFQVNGPVSMTLRPIKDYRLCFGVGVGATAAAAGAPATGAAAAGVPAAGGGTTGILLDREMLVLLELPPVLLLSAVLLLVLVCEFVVLLHLLDKLHQIRHRLFSNRIPINIGIRIYETA